MSPVLTAIGVNVWEWGIGTVTNKDIMAKVKVLVMYWTDICGPERERLARCEEWAIGGWILTNKNILWSQYMVTTRSSGWLVLVMYWTDICGQRSEWELVAH